MLDRDLYRFSNICSTLNNKVGGLILIRLFVYYNSSGTYITETIEGTMQRASDKL